MGLEGAVKLAMGKQLAAMEKEEDRNEAFKAMVDFAYERGKAMNTAAHLEIDAVIEPDETRSWLVRGLASVGPTERRRRFIDTW